MLAMMIEETSQNRNKVLAVDKKVDTQPEYCPAGCAKYYFDISGTFWYGARTDTVFVCIARNKENAVRKFNNWKNKAMLENLIIGKSKLIS